MKVNGKDYPYIMENKTCSKPPTRQVWSLTSPIFGFDEGR
jgi:hypothetical protein